MIGEKLETWSKYSVFWPDLGPQRPTPFWVSLIEGVSYGGCLFNIEGVAGNRTRVTAILAVGATATLSLRTTGGCFRGKG